MSFKELAANMRLLDVEPAPPWQGLLTEFFNAHEIKLGADDLEGMSFSAGGTAEQHEVSFGVGETHDFLMLEFVDTMLPPQDPVGLPDLLEKLNPLYQCHDFVGALLEFLDSRGRFMCLLVDGTVHTCVWLPAAEGWAATIYWELHPESFERDLNRVTPLF